MPIDIWELQKQTPNSTVVVTTNTKTRLNGHAVMGAGIAKQAADLYPNLPKELGEHLIEFDHEPDVIHWFGYRIITFPTKRDWRLPSTIDYIIISAQKLLILDLPGPILVPKVGCALGGLHWDDVKPCLEIVWSDCLDRFVFVE